MKRTGIRGGGIPSNLNSRIERKLLKLVLSPVCFIYFVMQRLYYLTFNI
jgi:hypothetical protein